MSGVWDAIVIGAGPAGMAAATTLAEGGMRTVVFDEQAAPGGQIHRAVERNARDAALSAVLGSDYAAGAAAAARLRESGADLRFGTSVWRVDTDRSVWTRAGAGIVCHKANALVIASGAMERPVPVPGWTLPGVMTIGALQILLKDAGLRPDGRLVLAGCGPLFYLFAAQCLQAGATELVLLDTAAPGNVLPALRYLPAAMRGRGPHYLWKGLHLLAKLRRAGVKIHRGVSGLQIRGSRRAEAVVFNAGGRPGRVECDIVALHEGVIPAQQIARSLDCIHEWDELQLCFRPALDRSGETSIPGVFIAGDGGGIVGAQASAHAGTLAALAILRRADRLPDAEFLARHAAARRGLGSHMAIRPFLDRLYRPRREVLEPADEVVVCRCEVVRAGDIREAARQGCIGPNQMKAFLRCGMGPCQGRMCGPAVSAIIARETGQSPAQTGYYRIRPPLKSVTMAELAGARAEE